MIMIFAGAGASKAVDPINYPTTVEFFQKLSNSVQENPIFYELLSHLKNEHGNEGPDIEEILFRLKELVDDLKKGSDPQSFFGWLTRQNKFRTLASHGHDTTLFSQMADDLIARISRLIDEINVHVYSFYGTEPTSKSLNKTWLNLLKGLREISPQSPIEIFTTNYDIVLESALGALENKNFIIETGRRKTHIFEALDLSPWNGGSYAPFLIHPSKTKVQLTKLHGSIDWTCEDGAKIHTASLGFRGDHDKHIILYPGFKNQPDTEPFVTFHNYFNSCLSKASLIVFIGFAFRDDHINSLLERNTLPETPIRVIDLHDDLENIPLENNQIEYVNTGFSRNGIKDFFSSLPPKEEW